MCRMPYVELELEPGVELIVETQDERPESEGPEMIGTEQVVKKAAAAFERSLDSARSATAKIFDQLVSKLPHKPESVEVEFSLKFSAKLDAWVVGSEGEGNFSVKLGWKPQNS